MFCLILLVSATITYFAITKNPLEKCKLGYKYLIEKEKKEKKFMKKIFHH
jgi:hypothetical protein